MIGRMQDIAAGAAGLMGVALVAYLGVMLVLGFLAELLTFMGL